MPRFGLLAGAMLLCLGCAPRSEPTFFPTGARPHDVAIADLDRDGEYDIVTANSKDITILAGRGERSFAPPRHIELSRAPAAVETLDANDDARPDLVVAYLGSRALGLLVANASGSYDHQLLPLGADARPGAEVVQSAVAVADINRDRRHDILVLQADPPRLVLLLGRAEGGFHEARAVATRPAPRSTPSLVVADVDRDSMPDVLCAFDTRIGKLAAVADHIRVLRNHRGNLVDETLYEVPYAPRHLAAADLDGNGVIDVAVTSKRRTTDLRGVGDGWLSASASHLPGRDLGDIVFVDLVGDVLPDMVATAPARSVVVVHENLGSWHFAPRRQIRVGKEPSRLAAVDLDWDGKHEIVAVNTGSSDVAVITLP
jgi:hypothetical protein